MKNKYTQTVITVFYALIVLMFGACFGGGSAINNVKSIKPLDLPEGKVLQLLCSTNIIGDVVGNIAGERANVLSLIPSGQNPHSFEPSPQDIVGVSKADLIFVNGFGLEEGLLDIIIENSKVPIIEVSRDIVVIETAEDSDHESEHSHDHGEIDPHTWTSPKNVMTWIKIILESLVTLDPENEAIYRNNYDEYLKKLQELDKYIKNQIDQLEESKRYIISDHRSWEYFARDYGFKTPITISDSFSTNAEPGPQALVQLIRYFRENHIYTLFLGLGGNNIMQRIAESIRTELNDEIDIVYLLTGTLNPPGNRGSNYIDFMQYNCELLINALKGQSD